MPREPTPLEAFSAPKAGAPEAGAPRTGAPRQAVADMRLRVERVLSEIRPAIQDDGGDVELIEVTAAGQVRLRFKGTCTACPSRDMTLQHGIERNLREFVPEVTSVVAEA